MRVALLILAVAGCEVSRSSSDLSGNQLGDGFFAAEDFSTTTDFAQPGADLAGVIFVPVDLAGDMSLKGDGSMSGVSTPNTCAGAVTLASGIELVDQDTTGLADDYRIGQLSNGSCNFNNNVYRAPDAAYTISVAAGKTLKVRVQPFNLPTRWDPAIAIVTDCASGASCVAGHDETDLMGNPEEVTWTNQSPSAVTVFIIVDCYYDDTATIDNYGRFNILAVIQ